MILKGRSAIITGASLGFGAAIAEEFVREGAKAAGCLWRPRVMTFLEMPVAI